MDGIYSHFFTLCCSGITMAAISSQSSWPSEATTYCEGNPEACTMNDIKPEGKWVSIMYTGRILDYRKEEAPTLPGGANIWFCQIFQKTAWNWKDFGPCRMRVGHRGAPLDPPLIHLFQLHYLETIIISQYSKMKMWLRFPCFPIVEFFHEYKEFFLGLARATMTKPVLPKRRLI